MTITALDAFYSEIPERQVSTDKDEVGKDQFLTLLVAQLKHQDPLNPMDGTDFTAQLAQFTQLEQQFQANEHLDEIQTAIGNQERGTWLDLIGKEVTTDDNALFVQQGMADQGAYTIEDGAEVSVYVYDANGLEVRRLYEGWKEAGAHEFLWDGKNNSGQTVGDGEYTFEVEAMDGDGFFVSHRNHVRGEVSGITYASGIPYLIIGNRQVSPSRVVEVTIPETTEPS